MPSHIRKIASWDDPYQRDRSLAQIGQFIGMMTERKQAKRQEKEERASQALRALSGVASSWSSEDWERNRTRLLQNMLEAGYTEDVAQVVIDSSISAAKRAEGAVSQKDAAQQAMQKAAQSLYTQVGVPQGLFNLGPWGMAAQRKPDTPAQAAQFLREQGRGEEAFMGQMGLKDLGMLTASETWVPPPKGEGEPPRPRLRTRTVREGGRRIQEVYDLDDPSRVIGRKDLGPVSDGKKGPEKEDQRKEERQSLDEAYKEYVAHRDQIKKEIGTTAWNGMSAEEKEDALGGPLLSKLEFKKEWLMDRAAGKEMVERSERDRLIEEYAAKYGISVEDAEIAFDAWQQRQGR